MLSAISVYSNQTCHTVVELV